MKPPTMNCLRATLAITLLSSCAFAFQGTGGSGSLAPPPLADAQFGAIHSGYFSSTLDIDAVFLDGSELVLLMQPEVFRTRMSGGYMVSVNDMATLPQGGINGLDGVAVVGPSGLSHLAWVDESDVWEVNDIEDVMWGNARRVRAGDLDGAGGVDLVGIASAASPTTVLVAISNGSGGYSSMFSFNTYSGQAAREVHLFDWDATAAAADDFAEIVVVTDYGIEVYDADGTPLAGVPVTNGPRIGTHISGQDGSERLCLVTSESAGPDELLLFAGENGTEATINIGSIGAVAITSWDRDGDGDSDIVLSINSAPTLITLEYISPNEPNFTATIVPTTPLDSLAFGDPTRDASGNQASVAIADFDHDGDDDLLAPAQGDYTGGQYYNKIYSEVVFLRGTAVDETLQQYTLTGSAAGLNAEAGGNWLWLYLASPQQALAFTQGVTTVKTTRAVWRANALGGTTVTAPHNTTGPISPDPDEYAFDLLQASMSFDDVYTIVIRQVLVDGNGTIVAHGSAMTGIYGSEDSDSDLKALLSTQTVSETYNIDDNNDPAGVVVGGPPAPGHEGEEGVRPT